MNIKATVITRHNPNGEYIEPVSKNEFKSLVDRITPASGTLNADGTVSWSGDVAMPIAMDTAETATQYIYDISLGPCRIQSGRAYDTLNGSATLTIPSGSYYADYGITFNTEFRVAPYVYLTVKSNASEISNVVIATVKGNTTKSGATIRVWRNDTSTSSAASCSVFWLAVGRDHV